MHTRPALLPDRPKPPSPRLAPRSGPPSISSGGTSRRASRVQYVMPENSVRHVGQTIALDAVIDVVAIARPPPPADEREVACGRGRGRGGGATGCTGAGNARTEAVVFSTMRLRRRTTKNIPTSPKITSTSSATPASNIGSAVARTLEGENPDSTTSRHRG